MAELVDAKDLKSFGAMHRVGSTPTPGTNVFNRSVAMAASVTLGLGLVVNEIVNRPGVINSQKAAFPG